MPFNYGGRNGVSTLIRIVKGMCRLYLSFSGSIIQYIDNSSLDAGQKTTVKNWLNGAQEACMILEEIQFSYEG